MGLLVDYMGRPFREGKAAISAELSGICARPNSSAASWWARLEKPSQGRLLGQVFAFSRERLREVAPRLGAHHVAYLCVMMSQPSASANASVVSHADAILFATGYPRDSRRFLPENKLSISLPSFETLH